MSIAVRLGAGLEGKYEIEREIGRGGMATVFLARDVRHGREVAVKVLHPELGAKVGPERFQREIRISASLQHANILPLFDSGEVDGLLYYVMPFVRGESLRDRLKREKQLSISEAVRIVSRVAEALDHAHAARLVHRDIKPENILLSDENVYVSDFGVARAVGTDESGSLTSTGMAVGTPYYMSPEQATADAIDARSDIYALGCVLYELLAGEPPYTGQSLQAVIARHMQAQAPDIRIVRPTVPDELQQVIEIALSKAPADRFQTAGEFAQAVGAAPLRATGARATTGARQQGATRTVEVPRWAAGLTGGRAMATLALLVVASSWFAWKQLSARPATDSNLLVVAPFNAFGAGLDSLREGLADLVSRGLDGAGSLRTVPPTRFASDVGATMDQASVGALVRREGARLGVFGSITRSNQDVRLAATVFDYEANAQLGEVDLTGSPTQMQLLADSLTLALLRVLVRDAIGKVQLESLRSSSLSALKAFLQGEQLARRALYDSAAIYFRRATVLDSTFALAFQRLSFVTIHQGTAHGQDSLQYIYAIRAGQLNRGLAKRESLLVAVDSMYAALSLGNIRDELQGARIRERLFAALTSATTAYPGDAEIAFRDAYARYGLAEQGRTLQILATFDRAIALDSGFAPAYIYAIELAAQLGGRDEAVRRINAYIALNPRGVDGDGMRLAQRLIADPAPPAAEAQRLINAASVEVAFSAFQPMSWFLDSAETAVQIARRIANDPTGAPELSFDPKWGEFLLGLMLGRRGHMREAYTSQSEVGVNDWIGAQLVFLGALPRDAAAEAYDSLHTRPLWPQDYTSRLPLALPFWGQVRDTTSLDRTAVRADSAVRATADPIVRTHMRYLMDAARAYSALARSDSVGALRRFLDLPDTVCVYCDGDKLTRAQLLRAAGRLPEARRALARRPVLTQYPLAVPWRLEQARVAMAEGDRDFARQEYQFVLDAWRRGDPHLQPVIQEARSALSQLGAR
ncbi:MAG: protein kinase domain-containing protein [Gemmatimonadota bacterium]